MARAAAVFQAVFGAAPSLRVQAQPQGRVNLIGERTGYSDGLVPPIDALVDVVKAAIGQGYRGLQGENATMYACRAAAGAGAVLA